MSDSVKVTKGARDMMFALSWDVSSVVVEGEKIIK